MIDYRYPMIGRMARRQRRALRSFLQLERLESRCMRAALVWASDSDGNWEDPTKWSGGSGIPKAGDTVLIDRGAANPTITIQSNVDIASLVTTENIVMASGRLRATGNIELHAGSFQWLQGTLQAANTHVFASALLQTSSTQSKTFVGHLKNSGVVDWQQPVVIVGLASNATLFTNEAAGVWIVSGTFSTGSSILFTNYGTFRKTTSADTVFSGFDRFDHRAGSIVEVLAGALRLPKSGTSINPSTGARFQVERDASVNLLQGDAYLIGTYAGSGQGRITFDAGRIRAIDSAGGTGLTLDFASGLFHWAQGSIFTEGSGGDRLTNIGHLQFSGDGSRSIQGQAFFNAGTIVQSDMGSTSFDGSGVFTNDVTGQFILDGTGGLSLGTFVNAGTVISHCELLDIQSTFDSNAGSRFVVTRGRTRISKGGKVGSTTIEVLAGAVVELNGPSSNAILRIQDQATLRGIGDGRIEMTGGSVESVNNSGTIDFAQGLFHWQGGGIYKELANKGFITIPAGTTASIGVSGALGTLRNYGTVVQSSGSSFANNTIINQPEGLWVLENDASIYGYNSLVTNAFINSGTLRKTGAGDSSIQGVRAFLSQSGGTVEILDGTLTAVHDGNAPSAGGHFNVAEGSTLRIPGTWSGTGLYTGSGGGEIIVTARLLGSDRSFTLDFPENMFTLSTTGSVFNNGSIRNVGFLTLDNTAETIYSRAYLQNDGTLIQSAGTNLQLGNFSITTNNGTWVLSGDNEIVLDEFSGLAALLTNNGELVHRTGSSMIYATGTEPKFSNTGSLIVESGTLEIEASAISQYNSAADSLISGHWVVDNGMLRLIDQSNGLDQPILENRAQIELKRATSSFPSINSIQMNSGSLALAGQRVVSFAGGFVNGQVRSATSIQETRLAYAGALVGLAFDAETGEVIVHSRNERVNNQPYFRRLDTSSQQVGSPLTQPGPALAEAGLTLTTAPMQLAETQLDASTLLFINSAQSPPTIYAMDKQSGEVRASLPVNGLTVNSAVGIAWHAERNAIYVLVQAGQVLEIDPQDGQVRKIITIPSFNMTGGGIEVDPQTGNLLLVRYGQNTMRVVNLEGQVLYDVNLANLGAKNDLWSDISVNPQTHELWLSSQGGEIYRLAPHAYGTYGSLQLASEVDIQVDGSFSSLGSIKLSVGGRPDEAKFSQIEVSGTATLAGQVIIVEDQAFVPIAGDAFQLLQYGSRQGNFNSVFASGYETLTEENGFYAFWERAPFVDLVVTQVNGPTEIIAGEPALIQWTVTNMGTEPAVGSWYDEVSLALNNTDDVNSPLALSAASYVVGGASVGEEMTLAPGQSVTLTRELAIAAVPIGNYVWMVETNRRASILEAKGRLNNKQTSADSVASDFHELTVDGQPLSDQFLSARSPRWFKVLVPAGREVSLDLNMSSTGASISELYASPATLPNRSNFTVQQIERGSANSSLLLPAHSADTTWFVMAYPAALPAAQVPFTISASVLPPQLDSVLNSVAGNVGSATFDLRGKRMHDGIQFVLIDSNGMRTDASRIVVTSSTSASATFPVTGLATGQYDLVLIDGSTETSRLRNAVTIEPLRSLAVEARISSSNRVRSGRTIPVTVRYENRSNVDIPLPFLTVSVTGGGVLKPRRLSTIADEQLVLLAPSVVDGSTVLPPGAHGFLTLYYEAPLDEGSFEITVRADSTADSSFANRPLDWQQYSSALRPTGVADGAWQDFMNSERQRYGDSIASVFAFLSNQIVRMGQAGLRDALFVNGRWLFELPEVEDGPTVVRGVEPSPIVGGTLGLSAIDGFKWLLPIGKLEGESTGDGQQNVYAVVVGDPQSNLPHATAEGNAWTGFFENTLNLPGNGDADQHVYSSNGTANTSVMLDNIAAAKAKADADDLIVVTYSGHSVCKFDPESKSFTGGELLFADGTISGSALNQALAGQTRTLAILDSCQSSSVTQELQAANISAVAAADLKQGVADSNSLSKHLLPLLIENPSVDLHEAVRTAASSMIQNDPRSMRRRDQAALQSINQLIRKGSTDRQQTPTETQALIDSLFTKQSIDDDGDGKIDAFLVDSDGDGTRESRIANFDQDDTLDQYDFGVPRPEPGKATFVKPINIEALTPEQREQYSAYAKWDEGVQSVKVFKRVAVPVLDARGGDLNLTNVVDSKSKSGGGGGGSGEGDDGGITSTVGDEQRTRGPNALTQGLRGRSFDPNEKLGPTGYGPEGFVAANDRFDFTINFENDPLQASLPAQEVSIKEQLDDSLDLRTFELTDITVGSRRFAIPAGRSYWSTNELIEVDGYEIDLRIEAELDFVLRQVTWTFTSLDVDTGRLIDEFSAGFLPVNDATGRGQGSVGYTIQAKDDLPTGTPFGGAAAIVFDVNDPLITNATLNTIDSDAPTSRIEALPEQSTPSFTVRWGGDDGSGSGVSTYDIFVSVDGASATLWLDQVAATEAIYSGLPGRNYRFYSQARDNVGLWEATDSEFDTMTTTTSSLWQNARNPLDVSNDTLVSAQDVLLVINDLNALSSRQLPAVGPSSGLPFLDVNGDGFVSPIDALLVINYLNRNQDGEGERLFDLDFLSENKDQYQDLDEELSPFDAILDNSDVFFFDLESLAEELDRLKRL